MMIPRHHHSCYSHSNSLSLTQADKFITRYVLNTLYCLNAFSHVWLLLYCWVKLGLNFSITLLYTELQAGTFVRIEQRGKKKYAGFFFSMSLKLLACFQNTVDCSNFQTFISDVSTHEKRNWYCIRYHSVCNKWTWKVHIWEHCKNLLRFTIMFLGGVYKRGICFRALGDYIVLYRCRK